ncbi:MAG TPA: CHRD domain-containing protein [Sphingomicrobium sp.]|nr:CHRD domain-containing protein [Sphingomicrobium sp.]
MLRHLIFATGAVAAIATVGTAANAQPASEGGRKFTTPMTGAEECNTNVTPTECGVGDPDGSATGSITVNVGQERVCWEFSNVANVDPVNRGHIHRAPAGSNGGIVVDFFNVAVGTQGPLTGCTTMGAGGVPLTKELLSDIIRNPSGYYLNLHNEPFPGGAIRGQLEKK